MTSNRARVLPAVLPVALGQVGPVTVSGPPAPDTTSAVITTASG